MEITVVIEAAMELGYSSMKPEQVEVAVALIEGRDVFACLPTGFVSPLVAIMKDQVSTYSIKGLKTTYVSGAPDGFDAVSVQNVGSTYTIVSWDLPTHSNGILINFSLYCNGALAGVLLQHHQPPPLHFVHVHVLQSRPQALHSSWNVVLGVISAPACPVMYMYTSRDISGKITHTIYPLSLPSPSPPHFPLLLQYISDTNDIVISVFINKIINPDKFFGSSSDPMCILLQLSSLLVGYCPKHS
ncbi:hypothetical protein EMCRGX_G016346 [Ephydatia muelleri]